MCDHRGSIKNVFYSNKSLLVPYMTTITRTKFLNNRNHYFSNDSQNTLKYTNFNGLSCKLYLVYTQTLGVSEQSNFACLIKTVEVTINH